MKYPCAFSSARTLVCVAALAALAAASVPAWSQGRDFRRDAEPSYRGDRIESVQDRGGNRGARLRVERAVYGVRGRGCDATAAVRNSSGGRRSLEVVANNDLCGDSAPNRPKTLTVTYRCGNEASRRARVAEGSAMRLSCR